MKNKRKTAIFLPVLIVLVIAVYSWFHVEGKEIDGALEISPECTVKIRVGNENQEEYTLDAEEINMLQKLILTSSFTRNLSTFVTYPSGTEHYTVLIDWNNQQDFLTIHTIGNEYISIVNQFDGKYLKINNPEWESSLKKIISLSNITIDNSIDNDEAEIDRSEYLTGEIITDGIYTYPSNGFGILYFVPDEESSQIIKEKYNTSRESLQLKYDNVAKVEHLPKELGIYKVKVDFDRESNWFAIKDIQLTDNIGRVLYEGKTYETNELDENVKVKDNVCGLIVKWIHRDEEEGGIQIRFAGEIESDGYYSINYDHMYDQNRGWIYFDEEYSGDIPFYSEKYYNDFSFLKTNELFDELQNFSSFGKGKFRTSNYLLIYNIGMGRPISDYLTGIISLDENYKDMFIFDKNTYVGLTGKAEDFIIVSSADYDENQNHISTDYYYINKKSPDKLFLFSSGSYNYDLKIAANENEFIMSTKGYNYSTGKNEGEHAIIFKITEDTVESKRLEGLSIEIDNNVIAYNMQGYISDIKIKENNLIITLSRIKMKKEDELAFGNLPSEADILIADYNMGGPPISVGDRIMINCKYTVDKVLYSFGYDISLR